MLILKELKLVCLSPDSFQGTCVSPNCAERRYLGFERGWELAAQELFQSLQLGFGHV
jgi:hypothetical protein